VKKSGNANLIFDQHKNAHLNSSPLFTIQMKSHLLFHARLLFEEPFLRFGNPQNNAQWKYVDYGVTYLHDFSWERTTQSMMRDRKTPCMNDYLASE